MKYNNLLVRSRIKEKSFFASLCTYWFKLANCDLAIWNQNATTERFEISKLTIEHKDEKKKKLKASRASFRHDHALSYKCVSRNGCGAADI